MPLSLSALENPRHAFKFSRFWYTLSALLGLPFVFVSFPFPLSSFVLKVVDRYFVPTRELSFFHTMSKCRISAVINKLGSCCPYCADFRKKTGFCCFSISLPDLRLSNDPKFRWFHSVHGAAEFKWPDTWLCTVNNSQAWMSTLCTSLKSSGALLLKLVAVLHEWMSLIDWWS